MSHHSAAQANARHVPPRPENQTAVPRICSRNANCCHEAKPQFTQKFPWQKSHRKQKPFLAANTVRTTFHSSNNKRAWISKASITFGVYDIHLLCLALSIGNETWKHDESCAKDSITVVRWCCRCFLLSLLALLLQRLDWPLYIYTMCEPWTYEHTCSNWSILIHLHLHLCCAATLETLKKECFDQAFAVDSTSCDTSKFSVALLWTHSWPRAQDEGNQAELPKHV